MQQVNIKSSYVASLLDNIIEHTGESKVDAVAKALEQRLAYLEGQSRALRTLDWLEHSVWQDVTDEHGQAPSKEEQEALLGF